MGWARIDDGFDDHPKVLALLDHDDGPAAIGLWTLCLTWAHRNTRRKGKNPGRLPSSLPRRYLGVLGRDAAKLLVDAGLWELADDGWQIHDFYEYLPTAETSEARSDAGKRGAAARWSGRKAAGGDSKEPFDDGKPLASDMASDSSAMATDGGPTALQAPRAAPGHDGTGGSSVDGKLPFVDGSEPLIDGKTVASNGSRTGAHRAIPKGIAPEPTPEPDSLTGGQGADAAQTPSRQKRATRIPDDFAVTPEMAEWARKNVPALIDAGRGKTATDRFIDHWHSAGGANARKRDWTAAWRNWMREADERLARGRGQPSGDTRSRGGQADDLSGEVYGQGRTKI